MPLQDNTYAHVKVLKPENALGVIHKHPFKNGAWFSGTDKSFINANHAVSIVIDADNLANAVVKTESPCAGEGNSLWVKGHVEGFKMIYRVRERSQFDEAVWNYRMGLEDAIDLVERYGKWGGVAEARALLRRLEPSQSERTGNGGESVPVEGPHPPAPQATGKESHPEGAGGSQPGSDPADSSSKPVEQPVKLPYLCRLGFHPRGERVIAGATPFTSIWKCPRCKQLYQG
jgi:hypothetical protein